MKRIFALFVILTLVLLPIPSVYAVSRSMTDTGHLGGGTGEWHVQSDGDIVPNIDSSQDIGASGGEVAVGYFDQIVLGGSTLNGTVERVIQFTPADFILNDGTNIAVLSASSAPGLELDNKAIAIVWADGEVTPIQVNFKVPADYSTGAGFRLFCDDSTGDATPTQVDFNVYVNTDGTKFDSATSDQTPVALSYDPGTPDMVALSTIATDFDSLAAGDVVSASFWRDNTAGVGTGDLEVYYAEFYYTATTD